MTRRNREIPCGRRRLHEACSRKNRRPSASRQRSGAIPSSTFLGAPHDNLPAEQGLDAEGEATNGQGPVAYPCSPELLNRHAERHVLRMATWKADELTDDVQVLPSRLPSQLVTSPKMFPGKVLPNWSRQSTCPRAVPSE